jgi:hypothetical protein
VRTLVIVVAFALLAACSNEPPVPTPAEASAAMTDAARLAWTTTSAPERSPIRMDASGKRVALVASGAPPLKPRSAKPPAISVSSVSGCESEGDAVACDTAYTVDGTRQPEQRVRYWRRAGEWRAHLMH